jgi:hypothetical protein
MLFRFHRTGCRLLILLLAAFAGLPASAAGAAGAAGPAPRPQSPIERLARLAKLWGTVRYFHPYLAYRDLDWDAAAVAAIPKVRTAKSAEDYRAAVAGMLAVLGDPATFVEPQTVAPAAAPDTTPTAPAARPPIFRWAEEGLLVVDLRPFSGYAIYSELPVALRQAIAEIPKAPHVALPGGINVLFTGHDVRHADGRQLQRVGLQPDIPVEPTIAGIRSGRDEVLERAQRYLMETTQK